MDRAIWPDLHDKLADVIARKTQAEWCEIMDATDVCFAPGPRPRRGAEASAQRRAQDLRRGGRGHPACARAALLGHSGRDPGPAAADRRARSRALADWGFSSAEIDGMFSRTEPVS
jgi:alpha-methylacyl-CoA racemase